MKTELGESKYQNTEKVFYRRPHDTASAFAQLRRLTVYNRVTFTMCNPSRNLWSSNRNLLTVSRARIAFLVNGPSDTQLLPPGTVCLSTSGTVLVWDNCSHFENTPYLFTIAFNSAFSYHLMTACAYEYDFYILHTACFKFLNITWRIEHLYLAKM